MSGALTALASLPGGAAGGIVGFLDGLVSTASWRGVPFYMLTSEEEAGQRVMKYLFPGAALARFQFLGALDGDMRVEALLIGQASVAAATALRAACQAPGPGMLVHPWLGSINVVLKEPARFAFSEREFGACRVELVFERFAPVPPPTPDWFGQLQDGADALMGQAQSLLGGVLGAAAAPLALLGWAQGVIAQAAVLYGGLGVGAGGSAINAALAPSAAALAVAAPALDASFPAAVAALLAAPPLALAAAATPPDSAAVASGPLLASAPAVPDPALSAAALLTAASGLAAPAGASPQNAAVSLAAQVQAAAQAAALGSTIPFDSAQAAASWGAQLDAGLAGVQAQAARLAASLPLVAGPVWQALATVRKLAAADLTDRATALPSLVSITTDRTQSAWRIALALYGDTPALMTPCVVDLWRRNAIRNPCAVPPGTYQVLVTG